MERPDWHSYFLGIAFAASCRSHDAETKHGAVIVDEHNHIVGTGYNGFMRKFNDKIFPNTRPGKYPFMIHAEENALYNCREQPWNLEKASIYVTGTPCNSCLQRCIHQGITSFYIAKRQGTRLETEETLKIQQTILGNSKINFEYLEVDLSWLEEMIRRVRA